MKAFAIAATALLLVSAKSSDWETQAKHDLASPGGKQYDAVAAKFSASILKQVIPTCTKSSPSTFTIYLKLGSGGAVVASSVTPVSPLSTCFATQMSKRVWPKPPFSPYVYRTDMLGNAEDF